ncbi:MAG: universal stress protein [Bacteroidota bacterium]
MSRILIPVDFSIPSHNAYRYGLHLAEELNMDVVLVHYYEGSFNPTKPLVIKGGESVNGSYLKRLKEFAYPTGDGIDYPLVEPPCGVSLEYEASVSLMPSSDIIKRAQQEDIDLVVMAPRSTKKFMGKWLGSTSTTVSEACERPVFLVPPEARFTAFDRIVVANNHATADPLPLWQLESLADLYEAKVHFVHIERADPPVEYRFVPWALMEELTGEDKGVDYPFEVVTVREDDITKGILDYAEAIEADLVVVVNRLRKRWQALFHASLTQDIALHSNDLPILVLHTQYDGIADRLMNSYTAENN